MRGSLYIELGEAMRIEAYEIEDLIAGLDEDLPRLAALVGVKQMIDLLPIVLRVHTERQVARGSRSERRSLR